ncbi:MAG: type I-E CRISPR-associated protein Cas7/Cse4/CasC [Nitrospirae bacterium CG01_land_8_20_14_3_00_44_22]|nr:MAG: type I-E CRISPR-associated protein Cas7/Cse4/CasC [Nitrospirae bacterium CG01_land_8_20_14_3_00_44_22]
MSTFIQLHMLTSYPPSNLNRDDLGRPKTAVMGGKNRLRVSSQSLKRAWRTSEIFEKTLDGHIGTRTRRLGKEKIISELPKDNPVSEVWAKDILAVYGEPDDEPGMLKQLVFVSPAEEKVLKEFLQEVKDALSNNNTGGAAIQEIRSLQAKRSEKTKAEDKKKITNQIVGKLRDLLLIAKITSAFDIAMFGRMLASSPTHNIEAAVQVAHAITVHEVAVEDDYFTAVDDLNRGKEEMGAAHIGETEFAAGVFYLYACINRDLLLENLGGDTELADKAIAALMEASAKVSPSGKQSSFASRACASYILAEKGNQQPRSLSVAFLKPVKGENILTTAISELEKRRDNFDKVYGPCYDDFKTLNAETGEGSLTEIINFVKE